MIWCYLGEVEHDVDKDERDTQHEDPKDKVKSKEPKIEIISKIFEKENNFYKQK